MEKRSPHGHDAQRHRQSPSPAQLGMNVDACSHRDGGNCCVHGSNASPTGTTSSIDSGIKSKRGSSGSSKAARNSYDGSRSTSRTSRASRMSNASDRNPTESPRHQQQQQHHQQLYQTPHHKQHHHHMSDGIESPPPLSSPSVASSIALSSGFSPLRRELSRTTLHDDGGTISPGGGKHDLARRLSLLAQRLTYGDDIDEVTLSNQVDQLEKTLGGSTIDVPGNLSSKHTSPPMSVDMQGPGPGDCGSLFGSPVSSLFRSRFSDLSASLSREREAEREAEEEAEREEEEQSRKMGMTPDQAIKVVVETTRLNEELTTLLTNLRARQEESEHIQNLLIERAERAAQRVIFLQDRITYLEQELHENDDELQHLRISLKAIEIQMPAHPDRELQRCIANFKDDYQALRKKRTYRSPLASVTSNDQTITSPTRW